MSVLSNGMIKGRFSRDAISVFRVQLLHPISFAGNSFYEVWDKQVVPLVDWTIELPFCREKSATDGCFVYAMQCIHGASGEVSFKVGITRNYTKRLSQIASSLPPGFSLKIVRVGCVSSRRAAESIETSILYAASLVGRWLRGEWIKASRKDEA